MERQYDLVVVGTGVTSAVASRCREAGWSVAVVDSHPFGGTCALRGCVPKKILVSAAAAVQAARDLADKGVPAGSLTIDWPSLMRFKRSLVDPTTQRTEQAWAKMGIEQFHGRARFVSATTLAVGADQLTGRHVVLAAGAVPAPLSFPGADRLITSEQFLNLDLLPARMVFVGGGYIAFEFAHVAARAGVEVTIVHRGARPLDAFDPDLVDLLVRRTRELGIRVELRHRGPRGRDPCRSDHRAGSSGWTGASLRDRHGGARGGSGAGPRRSRSRPGGRQARPAGWCRGERVSAVRVQPRRLRRRRRGHEWTGAHAKADHDAAVLATNLLEGNKRTVRYDGFASAVFSVPPLASAGLTEAAARAAGRQFRTHWQDTSSWFNTQRVGETVSAFKVLIDEGTDRVIGAHLLGPHADETINLFALAIRLGIPASELRQVLFAYPTFGSDVRFML